MHLRHLIHFFVIATLLLVGRAGVRVFNASQPELTVQVSGDSPLQPQVDRAILLEEARRSGWHRSDPVVFQRLVRNMRFVGAEEGMSDWDLFQRAIALGMDRHDPVVRARLVHRARQSLEYLAPDEQPNDEELRVHLDQYPERFMRPSALKFVQVFLSRDRRKETLALDAEALLQRLREEDPSPEAAHRMGDPLIATRAIQKGDQGVIDRRFGPGFFDQLAKIDEATWTGPLASPYGLHLVKVLGATAPRLPQLREVRAAVRYDLLKNRREAVAEDRLANLRRRYRVHLERSR